MTVHTEGNLVQYLKRLPCQMGQRAGVLTTPLTRLNRPNETRSSYVDSFYHFPVKNTIEYLPYPAPRKRGAIMAITITDRVLDDGRIEMKWDTINRREWNQALKLIKDSIPVNGRMFDKESKCWLIAGQYSGIYQNIKAALLTSDAEILAEIDEQLNDEVIANLMHQELTRLPPSMRRRANFAIKAAIGLIDAPVEFCISESIFGAWNEEEKHWCYENGRYSSSSPSEKDDKILQRAHKRLKAAIEGVDGAIESLDEDSPEQWKAKFRASILEAFDYRCYTCGDRPKNLSKLQMHRVTPGKNGGMYTEDNVVLVCTKCHRGLEGESWEYIHEYHRHNAGGE